MLPLLIVAMVLALAAFLLLMPVTLEVSYHDGFEARIRYLFLKFSWPSPEGQPSPEGEEAVGKETASSSPSLKEKLKMMLRREGLEGFLRTLQELAQAAGTASKKVLDRLQLKRFDLYICLGGEEDAAQAAIYYGQVCAVAYGACGVLFGALPCRKKRATVDLDYHSREDRVEFSGAVCIRVLFLLIEGFILLYKALPFFRKLQAAADTIERISQTRKQGEPK
ncbi:MAG: hypothetical protein ACOYJZ_07095 [Acutalibacter sp.]|jgi:hypothetical protein